MLRVNMFADAEEGIALALALMAVFLLSALGGALVLTTTTETAVAGSHRRSIEAFYAAEGALELASVELQRVPDWSTVLDGSVRAPAADGYPGGQRTLVDGSAIDLGEIVNMANCRSRAPCSASDLVADGGGTRPWAENNPVWRLYAYGPIADLLPGGIASSCYAVVLVGDDASENDGDPTRDGGPPVDPPDPAEPVNPGRGVIVVRAEAFGPRGAHRTVEVTLERTTRSRRVSWHEIR